jgi:hypothetical protein
VGTRVGEVKGLRITGIIRASVVVVANGGNVLVDTSHDGVTRILSARVLIITIRGIEGRDDTLGSLVVSLVRPVADVSGTHISIITISINRAGRRRTEQICVDDTSIG